MKRPLGLLRVAAKPRGARPGLLRQDKVVGAVPGLRARGASRRRVASIP